MQQAHSSKNIVNQGYILRSSLPPKPSRQTVRAIQRPLNIVPFPNPISTPPLPSLLPSLLLVRMFPPPIPPKQQPRRRPHPRKDQIPHESTDSRAQKGRPILMFLAMRVAAMRVRGPCVAVVIAVVIAVIVAR